MPAMAEVRYCTTEDGVRIAYCLEGEGPPLVVCPPSVASFSLGHLVPTGRAFLEQIGQGRKVVRYDMRGTGLSQRDATDFSGPALVLDIDAVVRAAGLKRFALWGSVMGGPRAIAYAAQHPGQVTHLILADTYARAAEAFPYEAAKGLAELCRTNWKLASQTVTDMGVRQEVADPGKRQMYAELSLQIARAEEESAEGGVFASMILEAYESWDVGHLLGQVRAKTLIFHHLNNVIFPVSVGRQLAAGIPGAVFVPLEGEFGNVGVIPEETPAVASTVNRFLGERREAKVASAPPAPVSTILFTDMEGSTAVTQRLGDAKAQEIIRTHNSIVRDALNAHGGSEIKHTGDGIMASFPSASRALECAVAIHRAFAQRNRGVGAGLKPAPTEPIRVRIGLNAGEPVAEESDLFGTAVQLAARICAKAEPGQILVSDVVRQLAAGKGFQFAGRDDVALKGFEEPVRLWEVGWEA
ncbi:MAG: adenylate/guanylate cyclase domain-containing protein [Chloroflexi bacterium]|nr:adenylate/guanylate cyclase domain-containing protein [Chloroflexota bacterium]